MEDTGLLLRAPITIDMIHSQTILDLIMGDTRDLISPQFPNSFNKITGTRVLFDTVIDISSNGVEDPVRQQGGGEA